MRKLLTTSAMLGFIVLAGPAFAQQAQPAPEGATPMPAPQVQQAAPAQPAAPMCGCCRQMMAAMMPPGGQQQQGGMMGQMPMATPPGASPAQ